MNNKIICSTGAYIGRDNNFDYKLIPEYAKDIYADGFELMMVHFWYPFLEKATDFLASSGVKFDIIHADKQIGVLFSESGEENIKEGIRRFEKNCEVGKAIGAKKLVLHLWGGPFSDSKMPEKIETLKILREISLKYGIDVMIENIPCQFNDPLQHWKEIYREIPDCRFIFDTRFAAFHSQFEQVFDEGWFDGRITHMHISDYDGHGKQFDRLRPIHMPKEGTIGEYFDEYFAKLKPLYHNTITLESPSLSENGFVDTKIINNALDYIRKSMN